MGSKQAARQKHVPMRTCVVCREKKAKRDLIRIVRTDEGIVVDSSGKLAGRGAYLCGRKSCWERAVKTNVLNKALQTALTDEDRLRLEKAQPSS
ncbi:MAG: YlxR family protein [Chloroflexi bacterium]|nr:MAG: DUF448 domain-containing protein [Phototrophicales bacterium]RMF78154.1 MAG: YlxR family protein [Chloroflexota bacterium]